MNVKKVTFLPSALQSASAVLDAANFPGEAVINLLSADVTRWMELFGADGNGFKARNHLRSLEVEFHIGDTGASPDDRRLMAAIDEAVAAIQSTHVQSSDWAWVDDGE